MIRPGLEIPDSDLEVAFIRSAGPGGQNVNKVASAVQLRFALDRNATLSAEVKARLRTLAGHHPRLVTSARRQMALVWSTFQERCEGCASNRLVSRSAD